MRRGSLPGLEAVRHSWALSIRESIVDFAACIFGPAQCLPLFSYPLQLSVPKKRNPFTLNQLQLTSDSQWKVGSSSYREKRFNKRDSVDTSHRRAGRGNVLGTFELFLEHLKLHLWPAVVEEPVRYK